MTGVYHLIYWMVDQPCQLSLVHQQPLLVSHLGFCGKEEERKITPSTMQSGLDYFYTVRVIYCRGEIERRAGLTSFIY